MFVTGAPSILSLENVMRLADPEFKIGGRFAGRAQSPVSYIFARNGYQIATGFWDDELFGPKGNYVQEYTTIESKAFLSNSTLCKYSNRKEKILQLFGFCSFVPSLLESETEPPQFYRDVYKVINEKAAKRDPWLTFHYMVDPIGHVPKAYTGHDAVAKSE
jgi:hypothetical protein